MKLAVVLFNLGGPDSPEAVEPFLRNLFGDEAILVMPWLLRKPLAWFIARGRAPIAGEIYAKIGGVLPSSRRQRLRRAALEQVLVKQGHDSRALYRHAVLEAVQCGCGA